MTKWQDTLSKEDIAISTRLRLARNIANRRFTPFVDSDYALETSGNIVDLISEDFKNDEYNFQQIGDLDIIDKLSLVENHLISPMLSENKESGAFILKKDETVSIMLNEEDHLRLQVLLPGLQLTKGWELASQIDDELESKLDYAYNREYGYLTSCPTNAGTGLRASVMLHLPGAVTLGQLKGTSEALRKIGFTVRGVYGEGSESVGDLFQISNQMTLGESEEEIISRLERIVLHLIRRELNARAFLIEKRHFQLEDSVYRALGVLKYSRLISSKEALKNLSMVKLGIELGLLEELKELEPLKLMFDVKPANLQKLLGKALKDTDRDQARSSYLRDYFI